MPREEQKKRGGEREKKCADVFYKLAHARIVYDCSMHV